MTKAKTNGSAAKKAPERERRDLGGIKVNPEAVQYMVWRYPDPACKGKSVACGVDIEDKQAGAWKRIDRFPITADADGGPWAPSWQRVLSTWGSGSYRFQFFASREGKLQSLGMGSPTTFNDPRFPTLPAYRKLAEEQPAASAAPAAAAPPEMAQDLSSVVSAAAKDGKLDVPVALFMIQLVQAQASTQEMQHRQWMDQERERRRELEADYQRRRERDAEWSRQENERLAQFWRGQVELAKEVRREAPADDRYEGLADAIDSLSETVEKQGKAQEETWEKLLNSPVGQAIAAKLLGPSPETKA